MTIDHESGEPVYMQVAAFIRTRITTGNITGRVPSARTITQEYGISHVTAEKALDLLRHEGLIYAVIGKGFYVTRRDDD